MNELDYKSLPAPIKKEDYKKLPAVIPVTSKPEEEKTWYSKIWDAVTGEDQTSKKAVEFIFGKDPEKKTINQPAQTISFGEGDNFESSKYKVASLRTIGKINPSPEDLDDPYIMETLMRNKTALDKEINDVQEQYSKTKDPVVLTSFFDTRIKPFFQKEDYSLKTDLQKDIYAKIQEQVSNNQPERFAEFQGVTLPKQIQLAGGLLSGFIDAINPFAEGYNPYNFQSQELRDINNEIDALKKYDELLVGRQKGGWAEPKLQGEEVYPGIKPYSNEVRTRADIGNKLAELENKRNELLGEQKAKLEKSEKDLTDLSSLESNFHEYVASNWDYKSETAELTRTNPDVLLNQNQEEFLYNLAKYGTVSSSLKNVTTSNTELLDANLLTFNSTWEGISLKDLLKVEKGSNKLDYYTSRIVGDKLRLQENTYKGVIKLEENIRANKDVEYGYPSIIKQLEKLKKDKIEEFKAKGIDITEEQLAPYNNEILKYTELLNKQDDLQEKLNYVKKNFLVNFKEEKSIREENSKLAQAYLQQESTPTIDYLKYEYSPVLNSIYGITLGNLESLERYIRKGEEKIGLISREQNIKDELNLYDFKESIFYIPEPIKNREAVKITEGEDGKYNFDYSLSGIVSEGITTFIESFALAKFGQIVGRNLSSLPYLGKAAPYFSESFRTGIGGAIASNFMLSDIDKQNFEAYLRGEITWDDVTTKSTLEKTLEGATEMLWTPELKMLDNVGQDIIKKYAKKQFLKKALGDSFIGEDLKYLAKSIVKNVVQTPLNESIEELAGNLGQDVLIDPIYKAKNLTYNPELNFTVLNNLQTAAVTSLSMIPTSILGMGGDVRNRRNIGKLMDYEIGKNSEEFLKYAISGINSLDTEQFNNIYPQFNSKEAAIEQTKKVYNEYNTAYVQSYKTLGALVSENQKRDYFDTNLDILRLVNKQNKTEKDVKTLLELQDKKLGYDAYAQDLKNKPLREQLSSTLDENLKNINFNDVNVPSLQSALEKLVTWKTIFGKEEKYKPQVDILNEKIKALSERITSLKVKTPEDVAKEQQEKVEESQAKGTLEIVTKRGKQLFEIGKKYLVGRTLDFDSKQPIKFPDVTFTGYALDTDGKPITKNGSPVVKFISGGKEYQAPISYFEDYMLGGQKAIESSDIASYYNKYKNKRFVLSLIPNKYNKLAKSKKFAKVDKDFVEGVLSYEDGKLYFNFINPTTGKEDSLELDDFTIKQYDTYKKNAFFKPKTAVVNGEIIDEVFENITPEDLERLGLMSEEEEKEYEEWVKSKEFKEQKVKREAQKQRRLEYLREYIKEISKDVLKTETKMQEVNEQIEKIQALIPLLRKAAKNTAFQPNAAFESLLTDKEFQEFKNLRPYFKSKFLLAKARSIEIGFQEDIKNLTDQLFELEEKRNNYQDQIQEELDFIDEIAESELDPDKSLKDQISEEREAIQNSIKTNESLIDSFKKQLEYLQDILDSFKTTLDNLFSLFSTERTSPFTNDEEAKVAQDITNLEAKIRKQEQENQELEKLLKLHTRLENFLAPLEAERKRKEKLRKRKEILEELKKQSEAEGSQNPPTGSNLTDKKQKDPGSAKKDLSVVPVSTTSGGENYQKFLEDPTNNHAAARYVHFTNSVNPTEFELMAVTASNVEAIKEKYGVDLSEILWEKGKDTDVKFVVVKKTKEGFSFVDMNGELIETPTKDNVIYTSLSKSETLLVSNEGKTRYNEKELPENKDEAKKVLDAVKEEFTNFRNSLLGSKDIVTYKITGVSRGIAEYDNKPNFQDEFKEDQEDQQTLFDNTINRKSIQGTIVPENKSLVGTLVIGTKGAKIQDHNGNDLNVPVGRPVVVSKEGAKTQFADNHHLSEKKAEDVFNIIRLLAKKINEATEEDFEEGRSIIDKKLAKYLKSVLYWRNPDVSKQETVNKNQIWISFDFEFGAILNIGNRKIQMSAIEENLETLRDAVSEIWHNVDAATLNRPNLEYVEITDVNVQTGDYEEVVWGSYEDYLMSNKNADGKTERDIKEIPLTTNLVTSVNPIDQNGKIIPNYTPQYKGRYLTFQRPIVSSNGAVSSPNNEAETPPTPPAAPTITETANIEQSIQRIFDSISQFVMDKLEVGSPLTNVSIKEKVEKNIAFLKSLKSGATYGLFDNNSLNNIFTFTPIIENGNISSIKIDIVNQGSFERFGQHVGGVENFLKLSGDPLNTISIFISERFSLQEVNPPSSAPVEDKAPSVQEEIPVDLFEDVDVQPDTDNTNNYRLATKTAYQKINIEKAKEWLNKVLPNIGFEDVSGLIDGVAWGVFRNNAITLSRLAEIGTEYHEAFEAVAGLLLTKKQWNALEEEFKRREGSFVEYNTGKTIKYSEATPSQIKEQLAEEFRDYQLSNGKLIFEGQLKRNNLFRRMYNLIKELIFGKTDTIQEVFQKISEGKYADTAPQRWTRPWNLNKAYRVANLENGIFAMQLNKSLSNMIIIHLIQNSKNNIYSLFESSDVIPTELYNEIKNQLESNYTKVTVNGELKTLPLIEKYGIEGIIKNLDNPEFLKAVITNINKTPKVFRDVWNQTLSENVDLEKRAIVFQTKLKDALTSYAYISSNWEEIVKNNVDYLKRYKIEISEVLDEDGGFIVTNEDLKQGNEYTPDAFSINARDNANSKVKFLVATLSKREVITVDNQIQFDENGLPRTREVINNLGLPEIVDYSAAFRTIFNVVINSTNIIEMLDAIKVAAVQNPELVPLWYRLAGNKNSLDLTEEEQRLRTSFNGSLNKFKANFVRGLYEETENGIVTNIIDSIQDQVERITKEKWLSNLKNLYKEGSAYFKEIEKGIKIEVKGTDLQRLAESKKLSDKIELAKRLGIDFSFDEKFLTDSEKKELSEALAEFQNVLLSTKDMAVILAGERVDFNATLDKLARLQYKIDKKTNEVNHYNIDKEKRYDIIGLSFFTTLVKDIRESKNIEELIAKNPDLKNIYHQGSFLLNSLLFNKNTKERTAFPIDIVPVEGAVDKLTQKGKDTSKLPFNEKILLEFNANLRGIFYILTPADVKTEYGLTYFGKIKNSEKRFTTTPRNYENLFNRFFRAYLNAEIQIARDIKENPTKRDVAEYNVPVITKNSGTRTKGTSLRAFDGILSFDYSQVIDDPSMDVNAWINANKEVILKDLEVFIENLNQETLEELKINELIIPLGKKLYALNGFDVDYLADNDIKQNQAKEEDVLNMINERNVNYVINIFEQFSLFLGDPAQSSDPFKRIKSFVTSHETTAYDTELTNGEVFDNFANRNYNKATIVNELGEKEEVQLPEDAPGHRAFDSTFTGTTIKDVEVVERTVDTIAEAHVERESSDLFFKPFDSLPSFLQDFLTTSVIAPIRKIYEKINETDGQGYLTLPLYREFLRRSDQWSPDLEAMYQFDMAYERSKTYTYPDTPQGRKLKEIDQKIIQKGNPNLQRAAEGLEPVTYPVLKPIGAGFKAGELSIRNLDKLSVMPLSYRLLESQGSKGLKIYNLAIKSKTDFLRYESAQKEGKPKKLTSIYNNEGKIIAEIASTDRLMFKYFSIQVETRGFKDKVARATQLTKIAIINLMNAGIPIDFIKSEISKRTDLPDASDITNATKLKQYFKDLNEFNKNMIKDALAKWNSLSEEEKLRISPVYKAVQEHTSILNTLTDLYKKELYEEIGAKETETGVEITNYKLLEKLIKEELEDRGTPENLLSAIKLKDGKFELPFDFLPNGFKVQPLLMSLVDSRIAKPKLKGKSLAQASSAMFEKEDRKLVYLKDGVWTPVEDYTQLSEEDKKTVEITSNELLFYGDKYVEENGKTRLATEKEIQSGEAKTANFIEIYLPPIFKDILGNFIDETGKIDPELLKMVGFRIPIQEISSSENIRIKGFLPLEYGNMVIVPSSITGKAGSDFDIDKLTMYLFHYFIKNGRPTKIKYLDNTNSTPEERYVHWVKENSNRDTQKYVKFLTKDQVQNIKTNFEIEIAKIKAKYQAISVGKKEELFQEMSEDIKSNINKETSLQDSYLNELFETGKKVFWSMDDITREPFWAVRDDIRRRGIKGPDEIRRYLSLTVGLLQNPNTLADDIAKLEELEKIYTQELRVMGVMSETIDKIKKDALDQFRNNKNALRNTLNLEKSSEFDFANTIYDEAKTEIGLEAAKEIANIEGLLSKEEFVNLPVEQQNTKKALENRYIDTLITLLELPENYTRLTTPNSAKVLQDGAVMIERLEKWAELRKEGKTDEEIEKMLDEESKQEKSKTKRLNISDWFNPVKNAKTRYSFQIGKGGVGIGAVGITNHAINQLVNSLGTNFNTVTLYFDTNPVEVTTIDGKKVLLTQLSFTRDSNGQWISNNISSFINAFVDIAKDPFIIKIHGNLDTAGSYIIANKLGMNINDTILLFNQPIIREFERLEALRNSNITTSTKEQVLANVISRFGKPGFISYDKEEMSYVRNILALKAQRGEKFTTEELENFIKNKNDRDSQRLEQTMLLATYLELKEGSDANRSAVNTYNWDTDSLIDFLSAMMKEIENVTYENESNPNKPKIFINTEGLFFSKIRQSYVDFTKMFKDLFISMQDEVFNSVTGREVQKFFDGYISDKDRLKAVTAIQREVVNYMILTTPIELYGKTVTIGEFVKALLVAVEKSPAKQLKSIQKKIKEGKVNSFYGIQELFSTIAGDGKRKTNNIRILNKQKDVEYSDTITDSWKEAENSSDQEISTFIRNLYLLALVQSGVNQSRISISQYLPSDFMKTIALQILEKLKEGKIDFSRFRPLFYANKWNDKNFTKKLSYKQVTYQDYDDPAIRYSLISHRKELGIKANTFSPGYATITKDENGNVNSVKITGYYLPDYQLSYTSLDINPKTGQKYTKQQADQAKKQGIDPYVTKIYQRVELNGSPVLVRNEKYYNFVYREVTKKGDGQYALEYADKSEIHTNLDPQSDSEIIAKFDEMNVTYTTVDEFKRSFSNPNEQSPFTQEAEDLTVKQLTQPTTPTQPSTQPTVSKEVKRELFDPSLPKVNIYASTGENAELSNFAERPFTLDENSIKILDRELYLGVKKGIEENFKGLEKIQFKSVEQAFQFMKSLFSEDNDKTEETAKEILNTTNGGTLKTLGRKFDLKQFTNPVTENKSIIWDNSASDIMKVLLKNSFEQNPKALEQLLATGNAELTHTQESVKSKWREEFPKLLMEVRQELKPNVVDNKEEIILKDGKFYNKQEINSKMLEKMGYTPMEIGKLLKEICG